MPARLPLRSTEHLVFLVAVGLVGLHVLDDGFLQPEPGTGAGDHVLYIGVFLAALAVAALLYGRLRAGARAALGATIGVAALTYGGVAIGEARGQGSPATTTRACCCSRRESRC